MGILIFMMVLLVELIFLTWSVVTKVRHDQEKMIARGCMVLLIVIFMIFGVLQGFDRYGILAIVLTIQIILAWLTRKKERALKIGGQIGKLFGNSLLYLLTLTMAIAFPQYKAPEVTGNHQIQVVEYTWVDPNRVETFTDTGENRAVTVRIWYPKEEGTYPLTIFSHGAFGVIDGNESTCRELASNGYVAVSMGHPYHSLFLEDTTGKLTIVDMGFINEVYEDNGSDTPEGEENVYHKSRKWQEVRCKDVNFALDTMIEKAKQGKEEPFNKIDITKIGLLGHSMGGATAVELGRTRDDIDAVIDIEGTMTGQYKDFVDGKYVYRDEPYPVPVLDINSRDVYDQAMSLPENTGETYVNFYTGERAKDFHEVVFEGAGHLNFTDLPLVSPILAKQLGMGTVDKRECINNLNGVVLNFFDYYVKGKGELTIQSEY